MSDLAKFLYTHNPFYLISAGCVLFGFRAVYQDSSSPNDAWMLAISLAAYTLLLAATAVVLVRWGKIWDDARTAALLSILMCLALSACFDATCHHAPLVARVVLSIGWLFSLGIIRLLRVGMPVYLPRIYRIPLLAIIALFFFFPLFVTSGVGQSFSANLAWRVLLFPMACGLLLLTLVPATRVGAAAVSNNGSPWPWPLYPWSIFFFLWLGMIGRSYLLTISFQLDQGTTSSFAPYYLIPIFAATTVVLCEGALAAKHLLTTRCLAIVSILLPGVASISGTSLAALVLQHQITQAMASPVWLTLVATALMSAWLWWRGAHAFKITLTLMFIALSGVSSSDQSLTEFNFHNPAPLAAILVYQIIRLLRGANTARYLVALALCVFATVLIAPDLSRWHLGAVPIHLTLGGSLLGAFWFRDWLALRLRAWMALWTLPMVIGAQCLGIARPELTQIASVYAVAVFSVALWIFVATKLRVWRAVTLATLLSSMLLVIGQLLLGQSWLIRSQANLALLAGAGCFICGAIISATKAGFGRGLKSLVGNEVDRIRMELLGADSCTTMATSQQSEKQQIPVELPKNTESDEGT